MTYRKDLLPLKGAKLTVYGDLMIDEYLRGTCDRVSPEGSFPVFRVDDRAPDLRLGGAGSALARARALGIDAQIVGLTGVGGESQAVRDAVAQICGDLETLRQVPVCGVTVKTRLLDAQGHQCLTRIDRDWHAKLDGPLEDLMIDCLKARRENCEWLLVSDYGKGMVTEAVSLAIMKQGWKMIVDSKLLHRGAHTCQLNRAAAGNVTHRSLMYDLERTGVDHLLITKGSAGLQLLKKVGDDYNFSSDRAREAPPTSVIGAGDQVAATYAGALAAGMDPVNAAALAEEISRLAVTMGKIPTITDVARTLPIGSLPRAGYSYEAQSNLRFEDAPMMGIFADEVRLGGQQLVFVNGVFDLFHPAHEFFLRRATHQARDPYFLVAINSDQSAKGIKREPIIDEDHRAQILKACRHVDTVCIFDESAPTELLEHMKPDVYVTSVEHARAATTRLVRRQGGDVCVLPRGEVSTTDIIKRIKERKR